MTIPGPRAASGREALRWIGAFMLTLAAVGVWFGLAPAELNHRVETSAIEARVDLSDAQPGVPSQKTDEYLKLLSQQLDEATRADVRDSRPAAMLGLVVIGLALLLLTAPPERQVKP